MAKWYVATMNDCIFITDEPPRPSTDDRVFKSGPSLVISLRSGSRDAQEVAEQIVAAHNGDLERLSHEFATALANSRPQPRSKKLKVEDSLRQSDLTARLAGRDNIEYGHHESLPRGEHVANRRGRHG